MSDQVIGASPRLAGVPRLTVIEVRRSIAVWFVPVLIGLGWWIGDRSMFAKPALWAETRIGFGFAVVVMAPVVAGIGAWTAGREGRRDVGEALGTMPGPAFQRDVAAWAGTSGWGMAAFLGVVLVVGIQVEREATWGGPEPATIVVGLAAMAAAAAFGHLVGVVVPGRFAAPLASGLLALAMNLYERASGPIDASMVGPLVPWTYFAASRWGPEPPPDAVYGWAMSFWLASVTGTLLAMVVLWRTRSRSAVAAAVLALLLLAVGAGGVVRAAADPGWEDGDGGRVHYRLICVASQPTLCAHPAYEPLLDPSAEVLETVAAPLAGIASLPERVDASNLGRWDDRGSVAIGLLDRRSAADREWYARQVAFALVRAAAETDAEVDRLGPMQIAVARWLVREAGVRGEGSEHETWVRSACFDGGTYGLAVPVERGRRAELTTCRTLALQAAGRFDALTDGERGAWLKEHFAALRAGRVGLEDLP